MNHRVMNGRITKNTIEQRVKDSKSSRNGRKRVRSEGDQGTKPKKRVKVLVFFSCAKIFLFENIVFGL